MGVAWPSPFSLLQPFSPEGSLGEDSCSMSPSPSGQSQRTPALHSQQQGILQEAKGSPHLPTQMCVGQNRQLGLKRCVVPGRWLSFLRL